MTMKPLKTCPICSSRRIHKVRRTFSQTIAGREIRVPNVECYECPNCGQRIYDPDAADKVLAAAPQATTPSRRVNDPADAADRSRHCPADGYIR